MDDLKKLADALASPRRWHELTDDECDAAAAVLRSVAAAQLVPEGGHVAWCRYKTSHTGRAPTSIILCDSDAEGAFKVYRAAPPPPAAQQAAEPADPYWIATKDRKPKGGQLIVKRWKNGAVWAGTHDEGPKNESFDWWLALPPADQARKGG